MRESTRKYQSHRETFNQDLQFLNQLKKLAGSWSTLILVLLELAVVFLFLLAKDVRYRHVYGVMTVCPSVLLTQKATECEFVQISGRETHQQTF